MMPLAFSRALQFALVPSSSSGKGVCKGVVRGSRSAREPPFAEPILRKQPTPVGENGGPVILRNLEGKLSLPKPNTNYEAFVMARPACGTTCPKI